MARPISVDWDETPCVTEEEIERAWSALDRKISLLLKGIMKEKGLSESALSRKTGFSQGNLNNVFNPNRRNHWSFPLLIATAKLLGTRASVLLYTADTLQQYGTSNAENHFSYEFKFKIGEAVVLKKELLESAVSRKDVRKFTVYAVYLTDEGVQYQVNDPKKEYQEEWEFLKEEDLIPLTSAEQARDKIRKALEVL